MHGSLAVGELHPGGDEQAAAGEDLALVVGDPALQQRAEAVVARLEHVLLEDAPGAVDRGELEVLLGGEVRVQAALAHPHLGGEAGDRDLVETVERGQLGGALEDRSAQPGAADAGTSRLLRGRMLGLAGHARKPNAENM